ncbi:MAG: hypothetical protein AAF639_15455 [Chloroflexota bacterium]
MNQRVRDIFEPLTSTQLTREQLLAHLEAMLTYCTGIKNQVPNEVLDETVNEQFALVNKLVCLKQKGSIGIIQ